MPSPPPPSPPPVPIEFDSFSWVEADIINSYPICGEGGYANNVMQLEIQQRPTHIPCGFDASRYIDTWKYIAFDQMDPSAQTVVRDQVPFQERTLYDVLPPPPGRTNLGVVADSQWVCTAVSFGRFKTSFVILDAGLNEVPLSPTAYPNPHVSAAAVGAIAQATGGVMPPCQLSATLLHPGTTTYPGGAIAGYTFNVHFSVDEYPSNVPVPERLAYVQGCLPYDARVYFQGLPESDPVCDGQADAPPNLLELRVRTQFSAASVRDNRFYLTLDSPLHYRDYRLGSFDLTEKLRIISSN